MLDVAALMAKERRFGLQTTISIIFYKMLVSLFQIQFLCFFLVSDGDFWFGFSFFSSSFGHHIFHSVTALLQTHNSAVNRIQQKVTGLTRHFVVLGYFFPTLNYHNFSSLLIFPYHINKSCVDQLVP